MDWEKKTEMIRLSNNSSDKTTRGEFLKYVVENISEFDNQAYDMFITGFQLLAEEMRVDIKFHTQLYPYILEKSLESDKFNLKTNLRFQMYIIHCENTLDLKYLNSK